MDGKLLRVGSLQGKLVENPPAQRSHTLIGNRNKTVVYDVTMILEREISFEILVLHGMRDMKVKRVRILGKLATVLRNRKVIAVSVRDFMRYGYKSSSPYNAQRMGNIMNELRGMGYVDRLPGAQWCLTGKGKELVALYYSWLAGEHDEEAGLV